MLPDEGDRSEDAPEAAAKVAAARVAASWEVAARAVGEWAVEVTERVFQAAAVWVEATE
jgi:hypothetical protein